jgi:AcrR family transcriptional regulator
MLKPDSRRLVYHNSFKAEIKEIAIELFAKRGYAMVGYRDIAFAVGIPQRTLTRYFLEKENVLIDDLDLGAVAFCDALRTQPRSLPPIEALEQAMLSAQYPHYHLEHLLAAIICREYCAKLRAAFNEFRQHWQAEVAAEIGEWLGVLKQTEFPPVFWASAIFTALEHTLRVEVGEAALAAEFTHPPAILALVFHQLRMIVGPPMPGISAPQGSADSAASAI